MEERKAVNREELLPKVDTPILILHGDKDSRVPVENSREAIEYLPEGSRLEVVPGAEHNLTEGYNQVINSTINWFKEHLK